MKLLRTANAGILLEMDGVRLLLDGVCPPYPPYLGTPSAIREALLQDPPDALLFTHRHPDHYDGEFAEAYQKETLRPIFWAEDLSVKTVGPLKVTPVATRHIGKADLPHASFIIEGSQCLWFTGDASQLVWKGCTLPKPDVVALPYAYAATHAAWKQTKALGAKKIVLLHLPRWEEDPLDIRGLVQDTAGGDPCLLIPEMGESITL